VQLFVTDVFQTMQGATVTEFIEQISTRCATATGHGLTDVLVAMLLGM
jgi:hypothetical protein